MNSLKEKLANSAKEMFAYLLENSEEIYDDFKIYKARNPVIVKDVICNHGDVYLAHELREKAFILEKLAAFRAQGKRVGDLEFYLIKAALVHHNEYCANLRNTSN